MSVPQQMSKRSSSIRSLPTQKVGTGTNGLRSSKTAAVNSQRQLTPPPRPNSPSIDFQLSKKTAELTMIVQMLFTQLHTKEAECELWQRYYNEFGETLLRELTNEKNLTATLQAKINEQDAALRKADDDAQSRAKDVDKFKADCAAAQERCQQFSNVYHTTLAEKDSLSNEVARLKNTLESQKEVCTGLEAELNKLLSQTKGSEKREKQSQSKLENEILKLQTENRELEAELAHMKTFADDMMAVKDKSEEDKRLLQANVESLRADFLALKEKYDAQRAAPFVNPMTQLIKDAEAEEKERRRRIASARKNLRSAAITCNLLTDEPKLDDELLTLRKELQRYKLELKNRDASFNRMFAAAAGRPSNNRNGNLLTSEDDDDGGGEDSSPTNSSMMARQPLVPSTLTSGNTNNRRAPSNTTRRVPLMPASFSSSTANSVRRSLVNNNNNSINNNNNPVPAKLPPVEINYK